jgi:hypothetical protein
VRELSTGKSRITVFHEDFMSHLCRIILLMVLLVLNTSRLGAQMPNFWRFDLQAKEDPTWVVAVELNEDNYLDLVVSNTIFFDEYLSVFLRNPAGGFTLHEDIPIPGGGVFDFSFGDFDEDGRIDLIVPCSTTDNVFLYLGEGDGGFSEPEVLWAGIDPHPVTVGDFNGDGHSDFVVSSWITGYLNVMLGNGDGTFEGPVSYFVRGGPNYSCLGDFNEDGFVDIAVANSTYNDVALLLGEGDGNFIIGETFDVLFDAYTLATGDFNSDGHLDLACATHRSLSVLHGDGTGSFERVQDFMTVMYFKWVQVGDMNNDGYDDISVCINEYSYVAIFPGNGSGLFSSYLPLEVGNNPRSLLLIDLDDDGHTDLLAASSGEDNVTILVNDLDDILLLNIHDATVSATGEGMIVNMNLTAQNRTELQVDCDLWLTVAVGNSPDELIPLDNLSWPANPLPLQLESGEIREIAATGITLPDSISGYYMLRIRIGEYPEDLFSIGSLEVPVLLKPPNG